MVAERVLCMRVLEWVARGSHPWVTFGRERGKRMGGWLRCVKRHAIEYGARELRGSVNWRRRGVMKVKAHGGPEASPRRRRPVMSNCLVTKI
jgi:hypothetical protein